MLMQPNAFDQREQSELATPAKEHFALARVQMIESFVRLEAEITKIILRVDPQFEANSPFAAKINKLKTLRKIEKVQLSDKALKRFEGLGQEIAKQTKFRNDLVHGLMTLIVHEGTTKAAFQNATDLAREFPQFTIIAIADLEDGKKQLNNLTNQLKQLANPPSPPQPSQGAVVDP
jgi:hypothetical protein